MACPLVSLLTIERPTLKSPNSPNSECSAVGWLLFLAACSRIALSSPAEADADDAELLNVLETGMSWNWHVVQVSLHQNMFIRFGSIWDLCWRVSFSFLCEVLGLHKVPEALMESKLLSITVAKTATTSKSQGFLWQVALSCCSNDLFRIPSAGAKVA